jgi:hypothetical protein
MKKSNTVIYEVCPHAPEVAPDAAAEARGLIVAEAPEPHVALAVAAPDSAVAAAMR